LDSGPDATRRLIISNVALGKTATQSSTFVTNGITGHASNAVDGNTDGVWLNGSVAHTTSYGGAWWEVDLGQSFIINEIKVYNRVDSCCKHILAGFELTILRAGTVVWTYNEPTTTGDPPDVSTLVVPSLIIGDTVKITQTTTEVLSLAEVEVYGEDLYNVAFGNNATQSYTGTWADYEEVALGSASNAVDGNTNGYWTMDQSNTMSHTGYDGPSIAWWKVELQRSFTIVEIKVHNRLDTDYSHRLAGFVLTILRAGTVVWTYQDNTPSTHNPPDISTLDVPYIIGDEVKITQTTIEALTLAEVEVYSSEKPSFYIQNAVTNQVLRADSCTDGAEVKLDSLDYNDDFQKFYFGADRTIVNSKCGGTYPAALSAAGCANDNRIYVQAMGSQDWEQQWALDVIDESSDGYFTANIEIGGSECVQVLSVAGGSMADGQPTTLWSKS